MNFKAMNNEISSTVRFGQTISRFDGIGPGEMNLCENSHVEVVVRGHPGGWTRGIFGSFPTDCVAFEDETLPNNCTSGVASLNDPLFLPLRSYQSKVLETAEVFNTIAFLPTGAGKTLIAVHLIKKRLNNLRSCNHDQGRQFIAFLAPTKILVGQQKRYIESHCDAKVVEFTGDTSSVEGSSHGSVYKSNWRDVFPTAEVIVMTPEILKQFLHRRFISVSCLDTMIIDECHHAFGSNSIVGICSFIAESGERRPIIFGMTASPIACKAGGGKQAVASRMAELERNLHCRLLCSEEMLREFRELVPVPKYSVHRYSSATEESLNDGEGAFKYHSNAAFILDSANMNFPTGAFSLASHVMRTLHYAYVRVKSASQLNEVYKTLRTAHLQPTDVSELQALSLPSHEMLQRLRTNSAGSGASDDTNSAHMLGWHSTHRFHALTDVTQDIGKVLSIAEECGIYCALLALRICLSGSQAEEASNSATKSDSADIDPAIVAPELVSAVASGPTARHRVNYIHQTDSQHLSSSVDLDRVSVLAGDLVACPFTALQLIHSEYVACVSLLDVFVSLASALGPTACMAARDALEKRYCDFSRSSASSESVAIPPFASPSTFGSTDLEEVSFSESVASPSSTLLVARQDVLTLLNALQSALASSGSEMVDLQSILYENADTPGIVLKQLVAAAKSSQEQGGLAPSYRSSELPVIHQLICQLLTKAADPQTQLNLSAEGVLTLLPEFCSVHRSDCIMTAEEIITAISDACSALIDYASVSDLPLLLTDEALSDDHVQTRSVSGSTEYSIRENYAVVSSKVKSLFEVWQDVTNWSQSSLDDTISESRSDAPSGIVFCRMRLSAEVLSILFATALNASMTFSTEESDAGSAVGSSTDVPLYITGQMKQKEQMKRLQQFGNSQSSVLFATDVVEEGLDVKVCQYVIHFDLPATVKSFIQRRGRARAVNSAIIALVPQGSVGDHMLKELESFSRQEREMELYAQRNGSGDRRSGQDMSLIDPVNVMESVLFARSTGIPTPDMTVGNQSLSEREDGEVVEQIVLSESLDVTEKYVVPSTGVQVDTRSSAQLLLQFCQMLPHDTYYSPRPVFWISTVKNEEPSSTTPGGRPQPQSLFRCAILLPPSLPPLCRCVVGPLSESKASAKGLASLAAIRLLHKAGELNDHLMTNGSKQSDKMERDALQSDTAVPQPPAEGVATEDITVGWKRDRGDAVSPSNNDAEMTPVPKKKKNRPATPTPDGDILRILVKTVPDCLTQTPVFHSIGTDAEQLVSLYMYAVRCDFIDEQTRDITLDCPSCSTNFRAINEFGVAFTTPLPSDVFQSVFDCNLRESECLVIKMELLEHKLVSRRQLYQMQRFHRAVLCFENECKRYRRSEYQPAEPDTNAYAGIPDEIWLPHNANLSHFTDGKGEETADQVDCERREREEPVDHDTWRASSNGAWYCIFPLPQDTYVDTRSNRSPDEGRESLLHVNINQDSDCTFHQPEKWYEYLRQSADEAQILLHNLRMQESMNRQDLEEYYPPFLNHGESVHHMQGLLVSRGSGGVFWVGEQDTQPELQKCLASVIKFVRPDHPEYVEISTFVPSAEVKAPPKLSNVYQEMMNEECAERGGVVKAVPPEQSLIPMTFADHFLLKYPRYAPIIRQLELDTTLRLVKVMQITSRLTLTYLLGRSYNNKLETKRLELSEMTSYSPFIPVQPPRKVHVRVRKVHSHCSPIYLLPDLCRPLGRVKWLSVGAVAPSIIWRIQSLLHSVEARVKIATVLEEIKANNPQSTTEPTAPELVLPRASIMLEALTPRLAKENLDSERLELLGDSLLKLVTTDELYRIYPNKHEGFLTSQRAKIISNMHLTEMCLQLGLDRYLRGFPLSTGKQQLLVRPPGMSLNAIKQGISLWNGNLIAKKGWGGACDDEVEEESGLTYRQLHKKTSSAAHAVNQKPVRPVSEEASLEAPHNKSDQQLAKEHSSSASFFGALFPVAQCESVQVKAKALADVMEAIIGGFYVEGGLRAGVAAIKALGAWPKVDATLSGALVASVATSSDEASLVEEDRKIAQSSLAMDQMVFPPYFPEPLKRIALGHTIALDLNSETNSPTGDMQDSENVEQISCNKRSLWTSRGGAGAVTQPVVDAIALAIGYTFHNWSLLEEALTHGSVQHRRSNQRLEFLGDAVLDFAVVSLLFKHQPWARQGDLSAQKSAATNNKNLGQFGARLQLFKYLSLASDLLEEEFLKLDTLMNGEDFSNSLNYPCDEEPVAKKQRTEHLEVGRLEGVSGRVSPAVESFLHGFTTSSEGLSAEPMAVEKLRAITACIRSPKVIPMGAGTTKTLADTFEALIAAVYLDSGCDMEVVSSVIRYINLLPQLA